MKLLFLTPQLPYPANSGGRIKSFRLLQNLVSEHSVHACCFLKGNDCDYLTRFKDELPEMLLTTSHINSDRSVKKYIGSFLYRSPFSVYRNYDKSFKEEIIRLSQNVDIIFVDHFLMYQYVPRGFKGKVIVHQHNAEHVMWSRFAKLERNPVKRILIQIESKRIKQFESSMCSASNAVLAAPNDIEKLRDILKKSKPANFIETMHLGDEKLLELSPINFSPTRDILFVGTMSWEANRDAALWFINAVFPLVRKELPDVRFRIVGKIAPQLAEVLALNEGVDVKGFVDNLSAEFEQCSVFVAPLRFGSGIKVKVVDALYRGLPVVSTPIGAEGLDDNAGMNFSICECAESMAKEVVSVASSEEKWIQLRDAGRDYARRSLSWQSVFDNVKKAFECQ